MIIFHINPFLVVRWSLSQSEFEGGRVGDYWGSILRAMSARGRKPPHNNMELGKLCCVTIVGSETCFKIRPVIFFGMQLGGVLNEDTSQWVLKMWQMIIYSYYYFHKFKT